MDVFSIAGYFLVTALFVYTLVNLTELTQLRMVHYACTGVYLITGSLFGVSMYVDRVETYRSALYLMSLSFLIAGVEILRAHMCKPKA